MKRLIVGALGALMLALTGATFVASATATDPVVVEKSSAVGSARWVTYPTCTATTTTLTCTGRAAGVQPQSIEGLGAVEVAIHAAVHYTCHSDPPFTLVYSGVPYFLGGDRPENVQVAEPFENGRVFSLEFTPPSAPPGINASATCSLLGGYWARDDPSYYNVDVRIVWGQLVSLKMIGLQAPIGTVSPG